MPKHVWLILALVALAALVLVLLFGGVDALSNRANSVASPNANELDARDASALHDANASRAQRVSAASAVAGASVSADSSDSTALDATLIVRVVAMATKEPLDSIRIELTSRDLSRPDVTASGDSARSNSPMTDAKGEAHIPVASGVDLDLEASSAREDVGIKDVVVSALGPGEHRDLVIELPVGSDLRVCGIVLRADDGQPIAGAAASAFITDAGASLARAAPGMQIERSRPDAARGRPFATTTTDANGRFVLSVPSWREAYACVTAKGFGPALADLAPGHEAKDKALTFRLNRGALIHAHIVDELGASIAGVTAVAHVEAFHLANDEESVGNALVRAPDATWKATTNAEGACTLEDLVTGMPLTVQLELQNRIRADVIAIGPLAPGETTAEWSILVGCELSGVFVDEADAPIPNAPLWLLSAATVRTGGEHWHFDDSARGPWRGLSRESLAVWGKTDGAGRFVLRDLDAGFWCVALELQRAYSAAEQNRQYIPEGHLVVISRGARHHEVVLHARHGLFISGKVFEPNGEASTRFAVLTAPSASIEWPIFRNARELQEGYYALTGADGVFRMGPLPAGEFELTARGYPNLAHGAPLPSRVKVKSGADKVIMRLGHHGVVSGRVIDAVTRRGTPAWIIVSPNYAVEHECEADGSFVIDDVGTVPRALIATTMDGRIGITRGVAVDGSQDVASVEVLVARGATLKLSYAGASPQLTLTIETDGILLGRPPLKRGERIYVVVPAGEIVVSYWAPDRELFPQRRVTVKPGDDLEIVLGDE